MTYKRNLEVSIEMNEDGFTRVDIHEHETSDHVHKTFQFHSPETENAEYRKWHAKFEDWIAREVVSWIITLDDEREIEIGPKIVTRSWKVYGVPGHRQRESFNKSYSYDWSIVNNVRKIEMLNSDITGTNDYSIIRITRNTAEECEAELLGQLSDGIFENSRIGSVIEIA